MRGSSPAWGGGGEEHDMTRARGDSLYGLVPLGCEGGLMRFVHDHEIPDLRRQRPVSTSGCLTKSIRRNDGLIRMVHGFTSNGRGGGKDRQRRGVDDDRSNLEAALKLVAHCCRRPDGARMSARLHQPRRRNSASITRPVSSCRGRPSSGQQESRRAALDERNGRLELERRNVDGGMLRRPQLAVNSRFRQ
jgi:hypothetical protein